MAKEISIICLFLTINNGCCQTLDDAKNLFTELFINKSYNKQVRPITDQYYAIPVTVYFELFGIHELDEVAEKIAVAGYLDIIWTDEQLVWDRAAYNDIGAIFVLQHKLRHIDVESSQSENSMGEIYKRLNRVTSQSDYNIGESYKRLNRVTSQSEYNIGESYKRLNRVSSHSEYNMCESYKRLNRVSSHSESYKRLNRVSSHSESYKRLNHVSSYSEYNMGELYKRLNRVSSHIFIIPADAGEKISYSVTVFLSFAVFLTMITAQLPINSESTSILSIYIVVQLGYCILFLVVNAFQLRIHHRKECNEKSKIYVIAVKLQRRICCWRKKIHHDTHEQGRIDVEDGRVTENASSKMNQIEDAIIWRDVSSAIDFFGFWILMGTDLIITLLIFIYISAIKPGISNSLNMNTNLSQLSISAWNVHGLGDKMKDQLFLETLNSDINILIETWTGVNKKTDLPDYVSISKSRKKKKKARRKSGGIIVLYRKALSKCITYGEKGTTSENRLWLKLDWNHFWF
ncbi:unnamed protein product [Mytilus coruscus]|uniref:Neurotransmitter-gated ion-channel ligand-binding domain-containing protein n=1 Tax=Mytilus coruscus TaxID=42192 RepID=A0A6J8D116_MYTCO|nr:unnamed protein product [Mytilus coruscus]